MDEQHAQLAATNNAKCNALTDDELFELFLQGKCPYEPEHLVSVPIGMFHCPVCGLMIVAGLPHPPFHWTGDYEKGYATHYDYYDYASDKINDSTQTEER